MRVCLLVAWWLLIVQGSGETLGEDANTLILTHTHTRIILAQTLNTHKTHKKTHEGQQLLPDILCSSVSLSDRRKKKFPEKERKRRGETPAVSPEGSALSGFFLSWR